MGACGRHVVSVTLCGRRNSLTVRIASCRTQFTSHRRGEDRRASHEQLPGRVSEMVSQPHKSDTTVAERSGCEFLISPVPPRTAFGSAGCSDSPETWRGRDASDLPDVASERDDVSGIGDELQRSWLVQALRNGAEGAVGIDAEEGTGVRVSRNPAAEPDQWPCGRAVL
jgi:hypothetical protein